MNKYPAVLTPLDDHMGLDIARTLHRRGIQTIGIDYDPKAPGRYSNACQFLLGPNPEGHGEADFVQFLLDTGKKLGQRAVLYPLSDLHVLICSRHRDRLREYYEYVMPDDETVNNLTTKDGLAAIVQKFDIPAPQTFFVHHGDEIHAVADKIRFPAILKPMESTYWHDPRITELLRRGLFAGRAKVLVCNTKDELKESYSLISQLDNRVVIQEVIPGEDSRLVYISFYLDRQSQPLGIFAGRKYRVIPTGFGSASYVRSLHDPQLVEAAFKLLSATHYQGLGGIEFKKDPRDEQYKLIEINTRFGMWDGLGARCGVDLAYIAYCDALGLPVTPQFTYRENIIWLDWQRDLRAAIEYRRKGQLTFNQWRQSLQGEKMLAIYSKDDWKPGAAFTLGLIEKFFSRMFSK